MDTYVISLGGSLFAKEKFDTTFINKFVKFIVKNSKDNGFIIVVGGGKTARNHIENAKKIGKISSEDADWIGIMATRLNAELIRASFGKNAYETVIYNPKEKIRTKKNIIIAAGFEPGNSTDYIAVSIAKTYKIKNIVNLTNVDYVYTKNPKKFKDAKPIEIATWNQIKSILGGKWTPGMNAPFDPVACREAEKLKLKVAIMNGDLQNLQRYLNSKMFKGTIIQA